MTTLEHADIHTVLRRFEAAIKRDQSRVDARPRRKFDPSYNDDMWRGWRNDHGMYLNQLLVTVADIHRSLLGRLSEVAQFYDSEKIRMGILEMLGEVVSGSVDRELYSTASQFLEGVIEYARGEDEIVRNEHTRLAFARWFPVTDPLKIAADPECKYGDSVSLALLIPERGAAVGA